MVQITTITTMPSSTNAAPAPVKEFITAPVSKFTKWRLNGAYVRCSCLSRPQRWTRCPTPWYAASPMARNAGAQNRARY